MQYQGDQDMVPVYNVLLTNICTDFNKKYYEIKKKKF